tara:strand:+ start:56 stop:475 length:420 start_codon:yes stop_codon:yes gene_type:complete
MTSSNYRRHQNQRLTKRKKRKHKDRCDAYARKQVEICNNILFSTWAGQVFKELDFDVIQTNHRILKNRLILDLKRNVKCINDAGDKYIAPPSFESYVYIDRISEAIESEATVSKATVSKARIPPVPIKTESWFSWLGFQ